MNNSLIYINFAPYENAGRILDFLIEEFSFLIVFSFDFHKLNNKSQSNTMMIYQDGRKISELKLYQLPTPESLLFISLPAIITLIALQTFVQLFRLRRQYGRFKFFLSVNAFTSWLGNIFRRFRFVQETIFWVWDYYPPGYPDWRVSLARWGYWRFDKAATRGSTRTVFLNRRLVELRQKIGVLLKNRHYRVVPIGTNPGQVLLPSQPIIGHLGVLKQTQGLDLLFDVLPKLLEKLPNLKVEIIGSGPDEAYFKARAKRFSCVTFYGFIKAEDKVDALIRHWSAGIATYIPDDSSPHYWTDPSKMKAYISQGVPVVTTATTPFATEIKLAKAGIVIDYYRQAQMVEAIVKLYRKTSYRQNAYELAHKYYYKKLYRKLFT